MLLKTAFRIKPHDVVALSGGGGKTTVMFRLATELSEAGQSVVTTMTTRIFVAQMEAAPTYLLYRDEPALLEALPAALARFRHVLIVGGVVAEKGKVQGLPPDVVGEIARLPGVDAVLVEADGSRRLPFKAPAAHEPVVPAATTILTPLAGLDAIGKPLSSDYVHRPELVALLTGARVGATITPEVVADTLAHADGGAKGLPPGARFVPLLNKVDIEDGLDVARQIARRLLSVQRVDSVILAAAGTADPAREVWGRVGAVVLAAGQATRFGALKQVQPWRGRPLVAHVAAQALQCPDISRIVVTTGAEAERVEEAARQAGDVEVVRVPDWPDGQSRSVKRGLAALRDHCSAILFLLADQPSVTPELLSALIQRHRETLAPVVAPRFGARRGNPVLFDAATFGEFSTLEGDVGARAIIGRHSDETAWVDWASPDILNDIDTPADYHAAL